MTTNTRLEYMLKVMSAALEGEVIEYYCRHFKDANWEEVLSPTWNWDIYEYRIKSKQPKIFYTILNLKNNTVSYTYTDKKHIHPFFLDYPDKFKIITLKEVEDNDNE